MVQLASLFAAVALTNAATFTNDVQAHPGQHTHQRSLVEIANSRLFKQNAHRSLKACEHDKNLRQLRQAAAERRQAKVRELRETAAAARRLAVADVLAKSHKSNLTGITAGTKVDSATLFGTTPQCILEPEVTQGPYYVQGELIRNDIREKQSGVDLYTELQIIDVNTCKPVTDLYVDFWHCNSTGVYAGVVASGNGNQNDLTNLDATFHRGLAPTDSEGIVQFTTKFPGHYTGRATHIHILGSHGGQVLSNNTYAGSTAASVGQLFFDQSLISAVEATGTYTTNKQTLTTNAQDDIFAQEVATGFDPVMSYVYLGDSVEDGIFAWVSVGVDATISKTVTGAAKLTATGGVAISGGAGGGMGGGSGQGGPGGQPPSGSFGGPGGAGSFGGQPPNGTFPGSGSFGGPGTVSPSTTPSTTTTTSTPKPNCSS